MAAVPPHPPEPLTLCLVGEFAVRRGQRPVPPGTVGSRKARTLLKLLAVESGRWIGQDRIAEVLWGDQPPQRPADNVATLVSRVRAALGAGVVDGGRDGYRLGAPVDVDLLLADAHRHEARRRAAAGEPALALAAAQRALQIVGDARILVEEGYADWLAPAQVLATDIARQARHDTARAALAVDEPATAAVAASAAVAADPYDEEAHRLLMLAEAGQGEPARALAAYERLRALLGAELGVDPAPQTREIHLAILREQSVPPAQPPTPVPAAPATVAGRDAELAELGRAWAAASRGTPGLLLITGEAGIGKTRLAEELVALAGRTGGTVLSARCYEAERSLFLQPLVEALGQHAARSSPAALQEAAGGWAGTLATLVPEISALVRGVPEQHASAEIQLRRAYDAVARYLYRLADTPVLLLLDDLHNAGVATVELLHYLVRQAGAARLLVAATVRADEGAPALRALAEIGQRVELGPLSPAAVTQLAGAAGQAPLAAGILARTGGHALFVVETLRALNAGEEGIPVSLRAAVLGRVGRTGPATEQLLRAAAVLGATIDPHTVAGVLDIPAVQATERCEAALAARLVTVAGRDYEFANDLIREVLYDSTPSPTRTAYHRRAADLLSARPEAVAAHAAAAGDWGRAARAFLLAGEQASHRFAAADAQALLTSALDAAERFGDLELTGRAQLARGRARDVLTAYDEALADYRAAARTARRAGDRRLEMMALRELGGDVPFALGLSIVECAANLRAGLRIAEALGDRANEADLLSRLAVLAAGRLDFVDALDYGQQAVRAARLSADDRALALALDGLKTGYAYLGEIDALSPILDELEPLLGKQNDLWRLQWTVQESAFPAIAASRFDEALERLSEALEVNRRSGYAAYEGWFLGQLGWVHRLRGDLDAALWHHRRGLELTQSSTHRWWRAAACAQLGTTLLAVDQPIEAIDWLTEGRTYAEHEGAEAYLASCLAPLAEATGDPDLLAAADALLTGVRAPAGSAWLLGAEGYLALARAWLHADRPDRAAALLAPVRAAAERTGWGWIVAAATEITPAPAR